MRFESLCESTREDAKYLPGYSAFKVFMRHSIRFDNPPDGNYDNLLLTPEGIRAAEEIGRNLDLPIGRLYSSRVGRCVQTVRTIARANGIEQPVIHTEKPYSFLKYASYPFEVMGVGWYEYYYGLQRGIDKYTGGYTARDEAEPIIDKIFEDEGEPGTLDIICSHDSHLVVLASALFDLKTGLKGENWVGYTEGLFLWGSREDFHARFRGEERHFRNW